MSDLNCCTRWWWPLNNPETTSRLPNLKKEKKKTFYLITFIGRCWYRLSIHNNLRYGNNEDIDLFRIFTRQSSVITLRKHDQSLRFIDQIRNLTLNQFFFYLKKNKRNVQHSWATMRPVIFSCYWNENIFFFFFKEPCVSRSCWGFQTAKKKTFRESFFIRKKMPKQLTNAI